jgi:hypothetical protein
MISKHIANRYRRVYIAHRDTVKDGDRLPVARPTLIPPTRDVSSAEQQSSPRWRFMVSVNGHGADATSRW